MKIDNNVANLIKGKNIAHISTIMEDGAPHLTPIWIDCDSDYLLVNTTETRIKTKNILRDNRAALSIVDSNNPYCWAFVRGKLVESTSNGADAHINKMSKKYLGMEEYLSADRNERRIILKIEPYKQSFYNPTG